MSVLRTDINDFILSNLEGHPKDIVALTSHHFGISRQRAHAYILRLIKQNKIIRAGKTRSARYYLLSGGTLEFSEKIRPGLAEDQVWTQYMKPKFMSYPENVYKITNYGFTEIFNNAIDHSEGDHIFTRVESDDKNVKIFVMDNGVGIFEKIQKALNLSSIRESILHLSKGKFTTDPSKHSGEGIFFTSRMFDSFSILSSDMYYSFKNNEWFLSDERRENFGKGTTIIMEISLSTNKTTQGVMDKYADAEIGFGKTIVAVRLSADEDDPHVSRSQAKRLMMGLNRFKKVVLDFNRVKEVGQAFTDEIFRVFANEHPDILLTYINANPNVEAMIGRVNATK